MYARIDMFFKSAGGLLDFISKRPIAEFWEIADLTGPGDILTSVVKFGEHIGKGDVSKIVEIGVVLHLP